MKKHVLSTRELLSRVSPFLVLGMILIIAIIPTIVFVSYLREFIMPHGNTSTSSYDLILNGSAITIYLGFETKENFFSINRPINVQIGIYDLTAQTANRSYWVEFGGSHNVFQSDDISMSWFPYGKGYVNVKYVGTNTSRPYPMSIWTHEGEGNVMFDNPGYHTCFITLYDNFGGDTKTIEEVIYTSPIETLEEWYLERVDLFIAIIAIFIAVIAIRKTIPYGEIKSKEEKIKDPTNHRNQTDSTTADQDITKGKFE